MNRAFVDTDVILDLLTQRTPHFHFATLLFTFAEKKKIILYTSPSVFINAFYILRKHLGIAEAKKALMRLRLLLHVIDADEKIIDLACLSDFSDLKMLYSIILHSNIGWVHLSPGISKITK